MDDRDLRRRALRLALTQPHLREDLLFLLRQAGGGGTFTVTFDRDDAVELELMLKGRGPSHAKHVITEALAH